MSTPGRDEVIAGRFAVDGPPLGEGRTGVVLPAWDDVAQRAVAVKLLHEHLVHEPGAVAHLRREAGAASRLQHPSLLVVYGLWAHGERWCLVSERLEGRSLDAATVAPLATASVLELGVELSRGLAALHAAGHVHGDVRPGHVMLADRGAVLLGFGQATAAATGVAVPGQTAPEVEQGSPPGVPADVYGLGVVLYFALTGRLPWSGDNPWTILGAQRAGPPDAPPGPRGLSRFLVDLLHPDPDRRPGDLEVVRRCLVALRDDPERRVRWDHGWLAPVDLSPSWAVHGTDPATGGPALVQAGLRRRRAQRLVRRLRGEGWQVRADRTALGLGDLLWIGGSAVVGGVVIPVLGLILAPLVVTWWRSRRVRPRLPRALASVQARVPPREVPAGTEHAVAAGLLLLLSAALLLFEPWWALVPGVLFVLLVAGAWRQRRVDRASRILQGRLESALAEIRHALAHHDLPLDEALAVEGEVDALERAWRTGRLGGDRVLAGLDRLQDRVLAAPPSDDPERRTLRRALQGARAELSRGPAERS